MYGNNRVHNPPVCIRYYSTEVSKMFAAFQIFISALYICSFHYRMGKMLRPTFKNIYMLYVFERKC